MLPLFKKSHKSIFFKVILFLLEFNHEFNPIQGLLGLGTYWPQHLVPGIVKGTNMSGTWLVSRHLCLSWGRRTQTPITTKWNRICRLGFRRRVLDNRERTYCRSHSIKLKSLLLFLLKYCYYCPLWSDKIRQAAFCFEVKLWNFMKLKCLVPAPTKFTQHSCREKRATKDAVWYMNSVLFWLYYLVQFKNLLINYEKCQSIELNNLCDWFLEYELNQLVELTVHFKVVELKPS